jgi:hypothetical protein
MVKLERVLKCRRERETVSACQGQFYQSILRERRTDAHFIIPCDVEICSCYS